MQHDFSYVLERIREITGLKTQEAVGELLGFDKKAFSKRVRRWSIPYEELHAWCSRESRSMDALLGLPPQELTPDEWRILDGYRAASPEGRLGIEALAEIARKAKEQEAPASAEGH